MSWGTDYERHIDRTGLLNGSLVHFDAQSTGGLERAKEFYKLAFRYIGSTETVYYDGLKDTDGKMHHLFVRKR